MNKYLKFTAAIAFLTLIIVVIGYAQQPPKKPQEKQYTVTLSIQDWQTVLNAISLPDDVTVNDKKSLVNKIVPQINKQLTDTTAKKK